MSKSNRTEEIYGLVDDLGEELDNFEDEVIKWVGDYDETSESQKDWQVEKSIKLLNEALKEIKKSKDKLIKNIESWGIND